MGKNTSTVTSTSGNPAAMSAYYNLLPQIQQVAQTPFVPYSGEFVAGVNPQQNLGISGINANAYSAQPYLTQAGGLLTSAGQPLTTSQINQYYSPYQQDVINATEAQFANTNAQQQQQVLGNAAAQGALGGDRTAVAQAVLAGQQQAQQAPVIAGLENQGYGQALQTAQQQFQQNPEAVAYGLGSTGTALENAGLTGATAQIGAGTLQQQTQQALDTALYNQFLQQQGFPFQELSWATGLETGLGGAMGGTSTTTPPAPNPISTYGGLGLAALGLFANRGGRIPRRGLATGGSPFGIMPYGGVPSYIPTAAAPTALHMNTPGTKNQQQPPKDPFTPQAITGADSGLKNILGNVLPGSDSYGGGNVFSGDAFGGSADSPLPGLSAADYGGDIGTDVTGLFSNRGGRVALAYGGLALPKNNRIQFKRGGVPVRAGLGLASFVKRRGFDEGGVADDEDGLSFSNRFQPATDLLIDPDEPSYAGLPAGTTQQAYKNLATEMPEGQPDASAYPAEFAGLSATTPVSQRVPLAPSQDSSGLGTTTLAFNDGRPVSRIDTPPAPQPELPPAHDYSADIKRPQGINFGLGLMSPEAKAGLLAAGLGMMASRSPYAGVGIGQGGLQGLQTYSGLKKQEQDVDLAVAKLNQQAKAEQDRIGLETKKFQAEYSQMTPYQKAQLQLTQEQRDFPRVIQTWRDQYGIEHQIYGIPGPNGTWVDPITRKPVQMPDLGAPGAAAPGVPATPPAVPPVPNAPPSGGPTPQNPSAPSASATPNLTAPVRVASLTDIPIPSGMTFNGAQVTPQTLAAPPADPPKPTNDKALEGLTPEDQEHVKALANYSELPNQLAARSPQHRDLLLARARMYDPSYQPAMAANVQKAKYDWVNGKHGDLVRNFSTAISHIDLLNGLISNLNNRGSNTWNNLANRFQSEFGMPAPTNYDAAARLVAQEIVKATVGGQNALGDREEIAANFNRNRSPDQQNGVIGVYRGLMAGQLHNLERQYRLSTKQDDFKGLLSPEAQEAFYGRGFGGAPQEGDRKQFKQGWGVYRNGQWVPEAQ